MIKPTDVKNSKKPWSKKEKVILVMLILIILILLAFPINQIIIFLEPDLTGPPYDITPESEFNIVDATVILNNTALNQEVCFLTFKSGEDIWWKDIYFQISNDGNDFYEIRYHTTVLGINVTIIDNNSTDPNRWDVGDKVIFSENGTVNWTQNTFFYCKIIYKPSRKAIQEVKTMIV